MSGFSDSRWGIAKQVQVGDRMPCYMTGGLGFFGMTEVTGSPIYDASPRWPGFEFAVWIPLKVIMVLPNSCGIHPRSLKTMSWIKGKSQNYWISRVRGALGRIDEEDGVIIADALNDLECRVGISLEHRKLS